MDRLAYEKRIEQLMREEGMSRAEARAWVAEHEPTLLLKALAEQHDAGYSR